MTGLCQKLGCPRQATHALSIGVPAVGDPEHMPLRGKLLMNVQLCEDHAEQADPAAFFELNPELKMLLQRGLGGITPDFDRAVAMGLPLDGADFLELQEIEAEGAADKPQ